MALFSKIKDLDFTTKILAFLFVCSIVWLIFNWVSILNSLNSMNTTLQEINQDLTKMNKDLTETLDKHRDNQ